VFRSTYSGHEGSGNPAQSRYILRVSLGSPSYPCLKVSRHPARSEESRLQSNETATQRSSLTPRLTSKRTAFLNLYLINVLIGVYQASLDQHAAGVDYEPVKRIL
jgi:hypothetical protein